jgi:hypothetical protein
MAPEVAEAAVEALPQVFHQQGVPVEMVHQDLC